MAVAENLRNKRLYKFILIYLKYIPFIIALCYFINTIFSIYGIELTFISYICGLSLFPLLFVLLASFVFKFCIYHRIPLYYIIVNDIVNTIDGHYTIPIEDKFYLIMHCILFGIGFSLIFIFRHKYNRQNDSDN